jgi:uncharacterized protein (UPF0303 family)
MDIADYEAQAARLVLAKFDLEDATALGDAITAMARAKKAPVVVSIRNASRVFYHAALPGSQPLNDHWARRKGETTLMFGEASMLVLLRKRAKGRTLEIDGLPNEDYALSGGAVPIRVQGVGIVAVATVSGLAEEEDHALVVRGIEFLMGR